MLPDGYELGEALDGEGRALSQYIAHLRREYWWPMRREWLTKGIDGESYARMRISWRRALTRCVTMWCPPMRILVKAAQPRGPSSSR